MATWFKLIRLCQTTSTARAAPLVAVDACIGACMYNTWLVCVHGSGMTIFDRSLDYELNTGGVYICFFISSFTDYKNTLFFVSIRNNLLWIDYWNGQFMIMFGFGCRMTISLTYELVCL